MASASSPVLNCRPSDAILEQSADVGGSTTRRQRANQLVQRGRATTIGDQTPRHPFGTALDRLCCIVHAAFYRPRRCAVAFDGYHWGFAGDFSPRYFQSYKTDSELSALYCLGFRRPGELTRELCMRRSVAATERYLDTRRPARRTESRAPHPAPPQKLPKIFSENCSSRDYASRATSLRRTQKGDASWPSAQSKFPKSNLIA